MDKSHLNAAQKEAVTCTQGPLLIVAGAGTGKTTAVTEKIAHIVTQGLALPEEILALAFNEKAAQEMEDRVDEKLALGYVDLQISTFHAFGERILERYGLDIGIPNTFRLLSDVDAWVLFRKHLYDFELEYYRPLGNPTKHIQELIVHFSKCKDELITPEEYLAYAEELELDTDNLHTEQKTKYTELARAYHRYNQLLLDNASLDFGDLIFYTVQLLEKREHIRNALHKQYKYILVDEFQDVNWAQYQLVRLLTGPNTQLTVVGDDDQSIYAFRGASVSNILRFKEDYPKAKDVVLTENYRSGQAILDASYRLVTHNNPDRLEEKLKIDKKLIAHGYEKNGQVRHLACGNAQEEARAVINEIISLKNADHTLSWDDFCILVRAHAHAEPFIARMEAGGIPYEYVSSGGLLRQPIVLDCTHYLNALTNTYDNLSLYRLLRLPFFKMAENDLHTLTTTEKRKAQHLYVLLKSPGLLPLSKEGRAIIDKIIALVHNGMRRARFEKPSTVVYEFLEGSGYLAYLTDEEEKGNAEVVRQIYYLDQFFQEVKRYEAMTPDATVNGLLDHLILLKEAGDIGKAGETSDTPDSVNIFTVHRSKGLEYPYVFVVNMAEGRFPSRDRGNGIDVPEALIKEQLPEGDSHIQEERRLCYVAMTRAKKALYLTSAEYYAGGKRKMKPSRFLDEIDAQATMVGRVIEEKAPLPERPLLPQKATRFEFSLPKQFSFSQINAFAACKYQYKLLYLLNIQPKGSHYFSFGNTMHNTLQAFYERVKAMNSVSQVSLFDLPQKNDARDGVIAPPLDELLSLYEQKWIGDWYLSERQREEYFKKGREALAKYYKTHEGRWTVPIVLESGFHVSLGGYKIYGKIDRIDHSPDGSLHIIDYKTGKAKETLTAEDKRQLLLYERAARILPEYRNIGNTKTLTYYYLNDNVELSFESTPADHKKFEEKMVAILDELHATDFHNIGKKDMCGRCVACSVAGSAPI